MATVVMDARGYRCPRPILMIMASIQKKEVGPGDILEVIADCPNFSREIRHWCDLSGKVLISMRDEEAASQRCLIRV